MRLRSAPCGVSLGLADGYGFNSNGALLTELLYEKAHCGLANGAADEPLSSACLSVSDLQQKTFEVSSSLFRSLHYL